MEKSILKNNFEKSNILVFLLFLTVWYCIFRFSGTFVQGYNIYEDNQVVTISNDLSNESFFTVAQKNISHDLKYLSRFRPVYFVYTIFTVKLFGVNLTYLTALSIFLCVLTTFFLFRFSVNLKYSATEAFLFAMFTIGGRQTSAWAELSAAEGIGMFFLSLTLFFLSKSIYSSFNNYNYKIFFVVFLVICSLCKETFAILIPGILYLYIWTFGIRNNLSFKESVKTNYRLITVVIIYFAIILSFFIFVLGINKQNYAGFDINAMFRDFMNGVLFKILTEPPFFIILLGIFITLVFAALKRKENIIHKFNKNYLRVIIFFVLITVPQCIVYLKSGFFDRYYLPYVFGFSFSLIYILKDVFQKTEIHKFIKYGYLIIVFTLLIYQIMENAIPPLKVFAKECSNNSKMINAIVENIGDDDLLIVMDPVQHFHEAYSLKTYLSYLKGTGKFKYDFVKADFISKYFSDSAGYNEGMIYAYEELGSNVIDSLYGDQSIKNIFVFSQLNNKFIKKENKWLDISKYRKEVYGRFILYFKD